MGRNPSSQAAEQYRDSVTLAESRSRQYDNELPNKANRKTAMTIKDLEKSIGERQGVNAHGEVEVTEGTVEEGDNIDYHSLKWWQASCIMIAETISLGILSLPSAFATLGVPGGFCLIIGLGLLTTYTGYNIGLFKIAYPHIRSMADAGEVMGGRWGREFLGNAQALFAVFISASHVLTGSIALQAIASDNVCTIVWGVIIAVVCAVFSFPRTFSKISYFSFVSFASIFSAVIFTMIAAGVIGKTGQISAKAQVGTGFRAGFIAATNIIFAYTGHANFINFVSELSNPKDYSKALYLLQFVDTTMYAVVGFVVYYYVGDAVTSPALGSLPQTLSRIAYGLALPTIIIAGVINGNVAAKLFMQRIYSEDSPHYRSSTKRGWAVWIIIVISVWAIAFIIAEVIPFFNDLLSVMSSLFGSIFSYSISGVFFLFLNPSNMWFNGRKMTFLSLLNMAIVAIGAVIMGCGLYASIQSIINGYASSGFPGPFTCEAR